MVNELRFQADSMNRVTDGYKNAVSDFNNVAWSLAKDDLNCFNFGAYCVGLQSGSEILCRIDQINARVTNHATTSQRLWGEGLQVMMIYEEMETKLLTLLGIVPGLRAVFNFFAGGELDQEDKMRAVIADLNSKMSEMVKNFEDVIAVLLANAALVVPALRESLSNADSALGVDVEERRQEYLRRLRSAPISSFAQMNVWQLIEQNPDIKRKGVMNGFYGE